MICVEVPLADRSYDVIVGRGASSDLASLVPPRATRAAIVTQDGIGIDVDPGIEHRVFTVDDGEQAKTLATVEALCRQWASWGLTRADVVIAVGGGVVTDTAGFAAAAYHRGIAVVHVSTTLLGMIDAAIGGKTGVNLPRGQEPGGRVLAAARSGVRPRSSRHASGAGAAVRASGSSPSTGSFREASAWSRSTWPNRSRSASGSRRPSSLRTSARAADGAILNYGHTLAHAIETIWRLRPAPRRGGGRRPRSTQLVPRAPARSHRRRPGGSAPAGSSTTTSSPTGFPAGSTTGSSSKCHGPRQEGRRGPHVRARRATRCRGGRRRRPRGGPRLARRRPVIDRTRHCHFTLSNHLDRLRPWRYDLQSE